MPLFSHMERLQHEHDFLQAPQTPDHILLLYIQADEGNSSLIFMLGPDYATLTQLSQCFELLCLHKNPNASP
jgi:hypothetical protein